MLSCRLSSAQHALTRTRTLTPNQAEHQAELGALLRLHHLLLDAPERPGEPVEHLGDVRRYAVRRCEEVCGDMRRHAET